MNLVLSLDLTNLGYNSPAIRNWSRHLMDGTEKKNCGLINSCYKWNFISLVERIPPDDGWINIPLNLVKDNY